MDNEHSEYEKLIKPIENQMIKSVWRITRDPDDADDALQEALTSIWKQRNKIRRHPNPQALILRICVNSAYDILRIKSRTEKPESLNKDFTNIPDPQPAADEMYVSNEKQTEIFQAILKLPRNQAIAALMRFALELPYGDIAHALGCREVTVRKHIARARTRLYSLLAHLLPNSPKEVQ